MKLISCHVENFGRLHDFDCLFRDGLNVIVHENGWGKSTLAAFLLAMLYGMPGKNRSRRSGDNIREAYGVEVHVHTSSRTGTPMLLPLAAVQKVEYEF